MATVNARDRAGGDHALRQGRVNVHWRETLGAAEARLFDENVLRLANAGGEVVPNGLLASGAEAGGI